MNIMVTGGNGFIGSAVSLRIRQEGYQVFDYDIQNNLDILDFERGFLSVDSGQRKL